MPTVTNTRPSSAVAPPARRRRRWPTVFATLYAGFTAAVLAVWLAAGDTGWTVTLNALQFWWTLPAVGLFLVAAAFRRPADAALLAVPALLWVWSYGGLFWGSPEAEAGELRIATYNTYIRAVDLTHVVALVRDEQPDVLLVQEVLPRQQDGLETRLGDELPHAWFGAPGRIGGVGLLSRYPIVDVRAIEPLSEVARPTAVVVLDVGGTRVQVVPAHLTSPCPHCGESVVERLRDEARSRRDEIDTIVAALEPGPAIVGGDFNSTRRNDPYRRLAAAGFRDPQIEAGSGPGFTWPDGSGPFVRIDWILVRGLVPTAAWVGPPRASDHHPVIVDVAISR